MKKAFTLVEILLVLSIMGIVMMLLVAAFRPLVNKADVYYALATLKTINDANENLMAENSNNGLLFAGDGVRASSKYTINYCNKFFDEVSTKGANNCASTGTTAVNLTLSNGVAILGLSKGWTAFSAASANGRMANYMEITIDTDGSTSTDNDRFVFIIYDYNGMAVPTGNYLTNADYSKAFKYIVTSKTQGTLSSTKNGVSFATAACITGLSKDLYTSNPTSPCTQNVSFCPNYWDCDIFLAKIPRFAGVFDLSQ